MKLLENGLIPVYENEKNEQLVNARELYEFVESKQDFSDWVKKRIEDVDAIDGEDFTIILGKSNGGRPSKEYVLRLDIAKEIAMLEKNLKGKQIRRYFISVEKKFREKQFESIDHLKKEQMQLQFVMDILRVNEGSKIKMLNKFNSVHNLTTAYLPEYTEEKMTKSLTALIKEHNVKISPIKFNPILIKLGILEEKERPSTKGTKKYKSLTELGLKYGKNLISPSNQLETQPHYYTDTFDELITLVMNNVERRCS